MQCLITGVAGFVGSHLADYLLAKGHSVRGIDNFVNFYPRALKEQNLEGPRSWKQFAFVEGNLLNSNMSALLDGIDWVFHLAAQAGVRTSWGAQFGRYIDYNILATQQLLEAARNSQEIQRFVYASSSSIYGEAATLPLVETALPQPISPYGVTKLAAEQLCTLYHRNFGVPTVALRYFTVYGPRQRPDMAFHRFCKAVIEHQPICIYDDGRQTRDFTYVADIVEANLLAATMDAAIGQAFNIAGGSRANLHQVLEILQEVSGSPIMSISIGKQAGDVRHTYADISRAQQFLDYHPRVSLENGLAREFEYVATLSQESIL